MDFIEIVHDDWCHICNNEIRHKDLLNFNTQEHGHHRVCMMHLGEMILKEVKK